MLKVGDTVHFDPFTDITGFGSNDNRGNYVTGEVVMINARNKWFSVEYGKTKARASFKFCDIGKSVNVSGK